MSRIVTEAEYRERFNRIMEYTQAIAPTRITEADPSAQQPEMPADPMGDSSPQGGVDPMMQGSDGMSMDDATNASPMGNAPSPQGQNAVNTGQDGVEGFNPQGGDDLPEEGNDEDNDIEDMEDGDEVIDVDALTGYQKRTAKGVGMLSKELKDLHKLITSFQEKVDANNQGLEKLQQELEKRTPNAEEKMSLRQQKSAPFNQSIENYWQNDAPENYSIEDDNNGADNPKYQITKADIDGVTDWNNIAKSFDEMTEFNTLHNIFGF